MPLDNAFRRVPFTLVAAALFVQAGCTDSRGFVDPTATAPVGLQANRASAGEEITFHVDWVLYNACVDEDLHGSGTVVASVRTVSTGKETRIIFRIVQLADDWQLVGLTTGDVWVLVPGVRQRLIATESGSFYKLVERFVFTNPESGAVLDWPARITFVTNSQGEIKVDRFEVEACRLRS